MANKFGITVAMKPALAKHCRRHRSSGFNEQHNKDLDLIHEETFLD